MGIILDEAGNVLLDQGGADIYDEAFAFAVTVAYEIFEPG
jgi:hypothetical protein